MDNNTKATLGERVSDAVAKFGGSWTFIFIAFTLIGIWVVLNTVTAFGFLHWDAYPFILLNLFLSLIAAFQAPFIMMSQRRVEVKQDAAYRGLFADLKNELINVKEVIKDLTNVLRDLKELVRQQSETIESLEEELSDIEEELSEIAESD